MTKLNVLLVLVCTSAVAFAGAPKSNRAVIDRMFEIVDSKQKLERLAEIEAVDMDGAMPSGPVKGTAAHQQMSAGFAAAFPNFKHVVKRCVESGEWISCEGTFSGDHTGPMHTPDGKTIAATNKHVEFGFVGYAHVKNGKIVELKVYFDQLAFLGQLGLVPGR